MAKNPENNKKKVIVILVSAVVIIAVAVTGVKMQWFSKENVGDGDNYTPSYDSEQTFNDQDTVKVPTSSEIAVEVDRTENEDGTVTVHMSDGSSFDISAEQNVADAKLAEESSDMTSDEFLKQMEEETARWNRLQEYVNSDPNNMKIWDRYWNPNFMVPGDQANWERYIHFIGLDPSTGEAVEKWDESRCKPVWGDPEPDADTHVTPDGRQTVTVYPENNETPPAQPQDEGKTFDESYYGNSEPGEIPAWAKDNYVGDNKTEPLYTGNWDDMQDLFERSMNNSLAESEASSEQPD